MQSTLYPTTNATVSTNTSTDTVTVNQNKPTAVVSWQSFNIGQNATVHFDQEGNRTWGVLNRIYDQNPTQIMGKMTADGTVYLINQNGILFGSKSQVNTNTLVASKLDVNNTDFQNGVMNFHTDNYNGTPNGTGVVNQGTITAGSGGSVFLVGPSVENSGAISAPSGQIGLAAGTDVSLTAPAAGSARNGLVISINQNPGTTTNDPGGSLTAETGLVGMYGGSVYQNGSVLASTSVLQSGAIELLASELISTGVGSLTASPINETGQTVDQRASTFQGGSITLAGLSSTAPPSLIEHYGTIQAPSGTVTINAGQRVYLAPGSIIDVSGLWLKEPISDDMLRLQLNSVQLQDSYQQKGGVLQGQNVTIWAIAAAQAVTGSTQSVANFSDALSARQETASEFATVGGKVTISSNSGDILMDRGSTVNISGGGIRYGGGNVNGTMLVSGNKVYDIADAPESLHYDAVLGNLVIQSLKWGVQEKFPGIYYGGANALPVGNSVGGYTEGSNAGILTLDARQVFLDGSISASAVSGVYQTQTGNQTLTDQNGNLYTNPLEHASGGTLIIGDQLGIYAGHAGSAQGSLSADYGIDAIEISANATASYLGPNYPAYGQNGMQTTVIAAQTLNGSGAGSVSLYTNTTFTLDGGASISLAPGSSLNVTARRIVDQGDITIPSGTVRMTLTENYASASLPLAEKIYLGPTSVIDVSGQKIDNSLASTGGGSSTPVVPGYLAGGHVYLEDETFVLGALNGLGVFMKPGAVINVSGGRSIGTTGTVSAGNAGSLLVQGAAIVLDGHLEALTIPAVSVASIPEGGSIVLRAENMEVTAARGVETTGAAAVPQLGADFDENTTLSGKYGSLAGNLTLSSNRLQQTGFTSIELDSMNNLQFDSGASISPSTAKLAMPFPGKIAGTLTTVSQQNVSSNSNGGFIGATSFTAKAGVGFDVVSANDANIP
ncbi:MAG: filamentous hemagglutinin N-terminal domain-containing protein, partial [Syntrophobacteraceae bacterium]